MNFTVDEMNIISIYDTSGRGNVISEMKQALPFVDDKEIRKIMTAAILKLEHMTDTEFSGLEFLSDTEPEDLEV